MKNNNKFFKFEKSVYPQVNREIRKRIRKNKSNCEIAANFVNRRAFYLRPALIILTARLFGKSTRDALLPAVAMQLSNEWLLIHDDLLDKSEFRRGGPTLHKVYGEELALNCGDYLQAEAWSAIAEYIIKYGTYRGKRLSEKFYDIINTTIDAQTLDVNFSRKTRDFSEVDEKDYYKIAGGKGSFYSVYGPLQLGAIIAGQPQRMINILKKIGEPAGVAAQIQNDILDMEEGTVSSRGYQDLYEGKLTLISLYVFNSATKSEKIKISSIFAKEREEKSDLDIEFLLNLIRKYEGLEYAAKKRDEFGHLADKMFVRYADSLPENRFKEILKSAITSEYRAYKHT
jgi:geranylgeranyl diphosphate synthase type II